MKQQSHFINDGDHRLHIRRIFGDTKGQPVLMLHGTIENGKIFYTDKGKGLACYLAKLGFDVYVADFRGKGESRPTIAEENAHGQTESITRDIPLFLDFVAQHNPKKVHVICHSWGGVLFASFLARYPEQLANIASKVCFGTKRIIHSRNFEKYWKIDLLWRYVARWLARNKGYIDAKKLKFGADNETLRALQQSNTWIYPGEWRDTDDGFDYFASAQQLSWPPTWHVTGIKDHVLGNPRDVKAFIAESNNKHAKFSVLSKAEGDLSDYGHIDILTSRLAVNDHFPKIAAWLQSVENVDQPNC